MSKVLTGLALFLFAGLANAECPPPGIWQWYGSERVCVIPQQPQQQAPAVVYVPVPTTTVHVQYSCFPAYACAPHPYGRYPYAGIPVYFGIGVNVRIGGHGGHHRHR